MHMSILKIDWNIPTGTAWTINLFLFKNIFSNAICIAAGHMNKKDLL